MTLRAFERRNTSHMTEFYKVLALAAIVLFDAFFWKL